MQKEKTQLTVEDISAKATRALIFCRETQKWNWLTEKGRVKMIKAENCPFCGKNHKAMRFEGEKRNGE